MAIRVPHPILYNFFISSSIYFFEVLQYIYLYLRLVHEFVLGDGNGARVGVVQQPRDHARLHAIQGDRVPPQNTNSGPSSAPAPLPHPALPPPAPHAAVES